MKVSQELTGLYSEKGSLIESLIELYNDEPQSSLDDEILQQYINEALQRLGSVEYSIALIEEPSLTNQRGEKK